MMKTVIFAAFSGVLLAAGAIYPVAAHQAYSAHNPQPQDFMAVYPDQTSAPAFRDDFGLHGPTNDTLSTATGGPVGGIPGRN